MDQGLIMALNKFLQHGLQGGHAFDSIAFCQNNLQDDKLSYLFDQMSKEGTKLRSLISVKNPIGEMSMNSLLNIIHPPYFEEGQMNKILQELNINES